MAQQVNPYTGQPAAPTPYGSAPIPFNHSKTLAMHAYHSAVANLRNERAETLDYYGMGKSGRLDPNNPYGQAQLLYRQQGQQINDLGNAQQQAGLYGGIYQGAGKGLASAQRNQALFAQGQETSQMLKEFQDRLQSIRLGMREAKWQKGADETSGTLQAIMNAISAGAFTPAAPYGG